jgi:hypothetical protein
LLLATNCRYHVVVKLEHSLTGNSRIIEILLHGLGQSEEKLVGVSLLHILLVNRILETLINLLRGVLHLVNEVIENIILVLHVSPVGALGIVLLLLVLVGVSWVAGKVVVVLGLLV